MRTLFPLSYLDTKTNSKIPKRRQRREGIKIQKSKPRAILIPAEGRKLWATALEGSLGSHGSLTSPPQPPRLHLIFDAWFHAVFGGEAFYLKNTLEQTALCLLGAEPREDLRQTQGQKIPQSKPASVFT